MTPPTADATEALARVLAKLIEAVERMNHHAKIILVDPLLREARAELKGVTLSPPAEAVTPVKAGAEALERAVERKMGAMGWRLVEWEAVFREGLLLSVEALPVQTGGGDMVVLSGDGYFMPVPRAALLAALTGGPR